MPDVTSLFAAAVALHQAGRLAEAEKIYNQILATQSDHFGSLHLLGVIMHQRGDHAQAIQQIDVALDKDPDNISALNNRGLVLHELKRFDEALASYDRALKLQSDLAGVLANRGRTLHELNRLDGALIDYDRALKLRPDFAEAFAHRGRTLHELKRFAEALASYDRALAVRPDYADVLCNRGVTLFELRRYEEALASYDRAYALRPDYAEALSNRGNVLRELKRFDEALACYERAAAVRHDYADANFGAALCRLLIGDFDRGWDKNEWRWETRLGRNRKRNFAQPLWRGSDDIAGKTVLLHAEQGFGDTIQFCRYLPLLAERGARVILEVQNVLRELMSTLAGAPEIVSRGDPLPDFELHCPLLSLPLAFGTRLETIPAATPYLRASAPAAMNWNVRLGPKSRPRIGLAWSGSPTHQKDRSRSIGLDSLLPLLAGFDATYVSLQPDLRSGDAALLQGRSDLLHFGDELKDFSATAALMSNLDLIISVDTSVAHLAGALAKPVWVLLPFVPDWRWLLDRDDSPWYPTARLYRQDDSREWDGVIARVGAALHDDARLSACQ
jgi:tetratricopeptide (TPR) repeat protein